MPPAASRQGPRAMASTVRPRRLCMRSAVALALPLLPLLAVAALGGCRDEAPRVTPVHAATSPAPAKSATPHENSAKDAGAGATAEISDAGATYDGPLIAALFHQTVVMSDMEWPKDDAKKGESKSVRLGYIRQGAKVPVIPEPHKKSNCQEGWYELVAGGFVCGKYATLDLNHPRVKSAPKPPDMSAPLPYQYGYNVTNGTPLYRTMPSREERLRYEPWLAGKKKTKKPVADDSDTSQDSAQTDLADAGLQLATSRTTAAEDDTPWYLKDYDGGRPMVTLDDLKGDGPVARRMVKGFYLSLDHSFPAQHPGWWKTQSGLITPYGAVWLQKPPTEFHGIWLNEKAEAKDGAKGDREKKEVDFKNPQAGVGFILWTKARKYIIGGEKKKAITGDPISRFSAVRLTGERTTIGGNIFAETEDGWWMKEQEGTRTKPGAAPADLAPGEKWIDVNLTTQTLVAFEGDKPVYATLVSTGRRNFQDKEKDHPTPPGTFRIREKHIAATMDGDGAADGPYSIEDVPWIMYFNGSYALHGAFWHANFGHVQSHGCVNLSPLDAKAMFGWTEPRVPDGWHGVNSTPERPGTRVVVHD